MDLSLSRRANRFLKLVEGLYTTVCSSNVCGLLCVCMYVLMYVSLERINEAKLILSQDDEATTPRINGLKVDFTCANGHARRHQPCAGDPCSKL